MQIKTEFLEVATQGQGDLIDLTKKIQSLLNQNNFTEGQVTAFVTGSTAGISTIEFEPGLKKDMIEIYEKIAPRNQSYHHHETWGDENGSSHVRATIQGPSLTVPFVDRSLLLGTWQQIVLMEFDTRPRDRKIVVQFLGV